MVHIVDLNGEHVFLCDACGFHYRDRKDADMCERFCNLNHSCSEEITAKSIERESISSKT